MEKIIYLVAGARPNFMKIAPLIRELKIENISYKLIHTGQHYDSEMSKVFFIDLGIPEPDHYLGVGSDSHAIQTAKIMIEFEKIIEHQPPNLVIVVGDVNSTIACALVAKKLHIDVAHIEAGLRSFDRTMPEEINRVLTDQISDLLFTTEKSAEINLKKEGIDSSKIFFVGNIMIDTLVRNIEKAKKISVLKTYNLKKGKFAVITLHRPSNVDYRKDLEKMVKLILLIQEKITLFFPIHPRTKKNLKNYYLLKKLQNKNIILSKPIGYLKFLNLMMNSRFILTDSGGIQEEASYLQIPVLTLRENTERPITVEQGTNVIVGNDFSKIKQYVDDILTENFKQGKQIERWDGNTAKRIVKIIMEKYKI
jgi:UDP-N-acetylglucosamine 2-epimerase (non-hydrolysing)